MTVIRTTTTMIAREISRPTMFTINTVRCLFRMPSPVARSFPDGFVHRLSVSRGISYSAVQCAATSKGAADGGKKAPARLSQVQEFLNAATERAQAAGDEPIPKINLDHVSVSFARSGGPGGQNVNKVNTKVDMRFNVKNADWLSERIRDKIIQMEKNRINKEGELVISSTKTRTQKGNIEDALAKLQVFMRQIKTFKEIIDAAAYVPPPPSEETVKKIKKLAAIGEQKRLDKKKAHSQKKALRRSRDSWD